MTEGSYNAPSLSVTDAGCTYLGSDSSSNKAKEKGFALAINQFDPFISLYNKLKDYRLREGPVLHDELRRLGVSEGDCPQAAEIFTANLRFLGLVEDIKGNDFVRNFGQVTSEAAPDDDLAPPKSLADDRATETAAVVERDNKNSASANRPELHINVQIHIDPTSSPELIDRIFSSMAKHLYGLE